MKRLKQLLNSAVLVMAISSPLSAQVNDQVQDQANSAVTVPWPLVQSFVPTFDNINGVGFGLGMTEERSVDYGINIWDALPSAVGANLLGGGTTSLVIPVGGWIAPTYFESISITPGATYYIQFLTGDNLPDYVLMNTTNSYPNGTAWSGAGPSADAGFNPVQGADFIFSTKGVPPAETTVPEPATMTLLATGMAAITAARKRRSRH